MIFQYVYFSFHSCCYQVLGIGYDDVMTGEDYQILRSMLKTSCQAKFRLAADFLATSCLSPEQVTHLI